MRLRNRLGAGLVALSVVGGVATASQAQNESPDFRSHPTTTPIRHLVVIFQENVSFDHYLATYPSAANPPGEARFVARDDTPTVNGLFDHVVPPTEPPGTPDEFLPAFQPGFRGLPPASGPLMPIGLGPRVPMTVVSPWSHGGWVDSEVFDHTSVLRFLEVWTGVHEPNISAWRRAICGDLTGCFDFESPHLIVPMLPDTTAARESTTGGAGQSRQRHAAVRRIRASLVARRRVPLRSCARERREHDRRATTCNIGMCWSRTRNPPWTWTRNGRASRTGPQ